MKFHNLAVELHQQNYGITHVNNCKNCAKTYNSNSEIVFSPFIWGHMETFAKHVAEILRRRETAIVSDFRHLS